MSRDFYHRFDLNIDLDEAQRRFVNRANNVILEAFLNEHFPYDLDKIRRRIVTALGERFHPYKPIDGYIGDDFIKCLTSIESVAGPIYARNYGEEFDRVVNSLLLQSEVDLGIRWEKGKFLRLGAKLLDDELVNKSLRWLDDKKYETVLAPFSKGLEHFVQSPKRPELLTDVITDMYEAVEGLGKIITGRQDKDLCANRELFLKQVKASDTYKVLLKGYIEYANNFRHALKEEEKRPSLSVAEVESFIYLTGIFIRLGIVE